jgi:hypothetical protein
VQSYVPAVAMEDYVAQSFANRDSAIPVVNIPEDAFVENESDDGANGTASEHASDVKSDGKLDTASKESHHKRHVSLQDRVFAK